MLFSMTGFGKAQGSFAGKKITVEIKSLNSKQFDLSSKIPQLYREKEMEIREMISDRLGRGKIDLSIYAESDEGDKKVSLNQSLASAYLNEIKRFAESGNIPIQGDILRTVLGMPDVLQAEKSDLSEEEWAYVSSLLKESIDKLMEFRGQEGEKLGKDIEARIHKIEELREAVIPHLDERIKVVRERLEKNVKDLIENDQGDKNRFEQEIVYYLEKLDITEEQVRLKGHCHYFLETMQVKDHPVGKKLGFISQEIGREINTMGSKANHVTIQRLVVQMKDELEKIKEQLLNIN